MRVLICGSRTFTDQAPIREAMERVEMKYSGPGVEFILIHGDAPGADRTAAFLAAYRDWDEIHAYPADWNQYGKRAGYLRNQQMLDEGKPDMVLAFKDKADSRGTDMMIDLAKKAGVPTYVWSSNGTHA